jgi:hypothetical protein
VRCGQPHAVASLAWRRWVVEPVSMTLGAIAAAAFAKAQERAADGVVDAGEGVLQRLVGWVRGRLSGDSVAVGALDRVKDAPDSPARVAALAAVIDQRAAADSAFADELTRLVEEIRGDVVGGQFVTEVFGNAQVGTILNVNQARDINL